MQATDPPIPKSKCSQQQINLPLAASALCCHAKLLIQTVVQKKAELIKSSAFFVQYSFPVIPSGAYDRASGFTGPSVCPS